MGEIISIKNTSENKTTCKMLLTQDEMISLKGHLKNIRLFNSSECNRDSKINTRGNNGVTKYFKIPLSLRPKRKKQNTLSYQKMETPSKIFYIYTLKEEIQKK